MTNGAGEECSSRGRVGTPTAGLKGRADLVPGGGPSIVPAAVAVRSRWTTSWPPGAPPRQHDRHGNPGGAPRHPAGPRGWLRHNNLPGDLSTVPRCGARAKRTSAPCRGPAMRNGRCRLHGGLSTGPRTAEGLARSRRARWKHGRYSIEADRAFRRLKAECQAFNAAAAVRRARLMAALRQLGQVDSRKAAERLANLIDPNRALREAARLAYSDIRELFDERGQLRPVKGWSDDVAAAVASSEVVRRHLGAGEDAQAVVLKLTLWDNVKILELLLKHLGAPGRAARTLGRAGHSARAPRR